MPKNEAGKTSEYKEATNNFLGKHHIGYCHGGASLQWFQAHINRLAPALFDRVMRGEILREIIDINEGVEAEDLMEFNLDDSRTVEANPFVAIAREVITRIATTYFGHLKEYLQARESALPDPEIEKIREKVAEGATALLQELEAIMPNFKPTERTDEDKKYIPVDLHMVIDADRVGTESGFYNVFKAIDIRNFEGTTVDGKSCGIHKNSYSGLRLIDVLSLWDPSSDVTLHNREGEETEPFAVINKDGTVDVNFERCQQIKPGMDMTLEKIPEEQQTNLVNQIVFSSGVKDVDLVREALKRNDLLPKWMVRFGNSTVYLSDKLYATETEKGKKGERTYTTIYVKNDKGLVVRSCYKSLSHAVWKLLPAYDDGLDWFHKGNGEEQIVLPPEIQRALLHLCTTEQMKDTELVSYGAVRAIKPAQSFVEEMQAIPVELGTGFRNDVRGNKKLDPKSPDSFQFHDENDKPNFSQIIDSWTEETALHGITTFDLFLSQNGRLRYLFCHDMRGRAWIAGIDIKEEGVTSQGIKKQWVRAGDLCTPAFDYWEQADGYGNDDLTAGHGNQYVDMYANYISHIPLIKEYQAWVLDEKDK